MVRRGGQKVVQSNETERGRGERKGGDRWSDSEDGYRSEAKESEKGGRGGREKTTKKKQRKRARRRVRKAGAVEKGGRGPRSGLGVYLGSPWGQDVSLAEVPGLEKAVAGPGPGRPSPPAGFRQLPGQEATHPLPTWSQRGLWTS